MTCINAYFIKHYLPVTETITYQLVTKSFIYLGFIGIKRVLIKIVLSFITLNANMHKYLRSLSRPPGLYYNVLLCWNIIWTKTGLETGKLGLTSA